MGKRFERFGEVGIADETNSFGLDYVEKKELVRGQLPKKGSSNLKKVGFGTCR